MKILNITARTALIILLVLLNTSILTANQEQYVKVKLGEEGKSLEQPITFLADNPVIDGLLDSSLVDLPVRKFSHVTKREKDNQVDDAHFRIAYGTQFLYLYVEVEAEEMQYRDRAYQNGDGFHFTLSNVLENDEPTDEFYVVACSAVDRSQMEWTRAIFWYYNVYNIFIRPSPDTVLEFVDGDGIISFELLLPWKDVHPYHPWLSKGIGFNLAFAKGIGKSNRNYYSLREKSDIGRENSPRNYFRLNFEKPELSERTQTFVQLERNNINAGDKLAANAVTIGGGESREDVALVVKSGEDTILFIDRHSYKVKPGMQKESWELSNTEHFVPGGYTINWSSQTNSSEGKTSLTVLPAGGVGGLLTQLDTVKGKLSPGSYTTFKFEIDELISDLNKTHVYETVAKQRIAISKLGEKLDLAAKGIDSTADQRGPVRRAYQSKLDNTLQPYVVITPADFDSEGKYPLVVFLHGSASDETNILGFRRALPDGFFGLGPKGRGPSNLYVLDNAQTDIVESIEDVVKNYPIDTDNIILAGFSMGGWGVYRTHYETPDKYKALAIFSGDPSLAKRWLEDSEEPDFSQSKFLKPFNDVPMFIFHGKADLNCPFDKTEKLVESLITAGAEVVFCFEDEKGHEPPNQATIDTFQKWLLEIVKK